jgi:hypothetical protein
LAVPGVAGFIAAIAVALVDSASWALFVSIIMLVSFVVMPVACWEVIPTFALFVVMSAACCEVIPGEPIGPCIP